MAFIYPKWAPVIFYRPLRYLEGGSPPLINGKINIYVTNYNLNKSVVTFRKYLPILKNMPIQYIHEPWLAPENVQRTTKCVIGKDYPLPMVNHATASRINIQRMKQVYQQLTIYNLKENIRPDGVIGEDYRRVSVASVGNPVVITMCNQSI